MNPTGHIGVKGRPEGFHQIISQRRCMFPGLMKNAEAGIQPQSKEILQYARQQNSVRIVEEVIKPLLGGV